MEASQMLIEALKAYPGTLLFVSHNRYFVGELAGRIIELTQDGIQDYRCGFEEYLQKREIDLLAKTARQKQTSNEKPAALEAYEEQKQQKRTKSQLERKAVAAEEKCHEIEKKLLGVNAKFAQEGFYQTAAKEEIDRLVKEKQALEQQLELALSEWEAIEKAKA